MSERLIQIQISFTGMNVQVTLLPKLSLSRTRTELVLLFITAHPNLQPQNIHFLHKTILSVVERTVGDASWFTEHLFREIRRDSATSPCRGDYIPRAITDSQTKAPFTSQNTHLHSAACSSMCKHFFFLHFIVAFFQHYLLCECHL